MTNLLNKIKSSPHSVQLCIIFLISSWAWFFMTYHSVLQSNPPIKQIICGLVICIFVLSFKNWARLLAIFFNAALIMLNLLLTFIWFAKGGQGQGIISGITVGFFSISTYYLVVRETREFYKQMSPKPEDQTADEGTSQRSDDDISPDSKGKKKKKKSRRSSRS